jgi:ribosomal protein S18 acetylase RimI-like enzyme
VNSKNEQEGLPGGYEIREIETTDFELLWERHRDRFFDFQNLIFRVEETLTPEDREKSAVLRRKMGEPYRLNLGLYFNGEFVGWAWGIQESTETFYMCNSAVFPEHRGKGLYSALMRGTLERVVALGFQRIYSRHVVTNNAILIAKLKAGFKITHFELSDRFGVVVHLTKYAKEVRHQVLELRAGSLMPDSGLRGFFGSMDDRVPR